jgi:hypothetical protein
LKLFGCCCEQLQGTLTSFVACGVSHGALQVVELILKNQSVLHGREMHLSVADIAHLAMLREPSGRIAE